MAEALRRQLEHWPAEPLESPRDSRLLAEIVCWTPEFSISERNDYSLALAQVLALFESGSAFASALYGDTPAALQGSRYEELHVGFCFTVHKLFEAGGAASEDDAALLTRLRNMYTKRLDHYSTREDIDEVMFTQTLRDRMEAVGLADIRFASSARHAPAARGVAAETLKRKLEAAASAAVPLTLNEIVLIDDTVQWKFEHPILGDSIHTHILWLLLGVFKTPSALANAISAVHSAAQHVDVNLAVFCFMVHKLYYKQMTASAFEKNQLRLLRAEEVARNPALLGNLSSEYVDARLFSDEMQARIADVGLAAADEPPSFEKTVYLSASEESSLWLKMNLWEIDTGTRITSPPTGAEIDAVERIVQWIMYERIDDDNTYSKILARMLEIFGDADAFTTTIYGGAPDRASALTSFCFNVHKMASTGDRASEDDNMRLEQIRVAARSKGALATFHRLTVDRHVFSETLLRRMRRVGFAHDARAFALPYTSIVQRLLAKLNSYPQTHLRLAAEEIDAIERTVQWDFLDEIDAPSPRATLLALLLRKFANADRLSSALYGSVLRRPSELSSGALTRFCFTVHILFTAKEAPSSDDIVYLETLRRIAARMFEPADRLFRSAAGHALMDRHMFSETLRRRMFATHLKYDGDEVGAPDPYEAQKLLMHLLHRRSVSAETDMHLTYPQMAIVEQIVQWRVRTPISKHSVYRDLLDHLLAAYPTVAEFRKAIYGSKLHVSHQTSGIHPRLTNFCFRVHLRAHRQEQAGREDMLALAILRRTKRAEDKIAWAESIFPSVDSLIFSETMLERLSRSGFLQEKEEITKKRPHGDIDLPRSTLALLDDTFPSLDEDLDLYELAYEPPPPKKTRSPIETLHAALIEHRQAGSANTLEPPLSDAELDVLESIVQWRMDEDIDAPSHYREILLLLLDMLDRVATENAAAAFVSLVYGKARTNKKFHPMLTSTAFAVHVLFRRKAARPGVIAEPLKTLRRLKRVRLFDERVRSMIAAKYGALVDSTQLRALFYNRNAALVAKARAIVGELHGSAQVDAADRALFSEMLSKTTPARKSFFAAKTRDVDRALFTPVVLARLHWVLGIVDLHDAPPGEESYSVQTDEEVYNLLFG